MYQGKGTHVSTKYPNASNKDTKINYIFSWKVSFRTPKGLSSDVHLHAPFIWRWNKPNSITSTSFCVHVPSPWQDTRSSTQPGGCPHVSAYVTLDKCFLLLFRPRPTSLYATAVLPPPIQTLKAKKEVYIKHISLQILCFPKSKKQILYSPSGVNMKAVICERECCVICWNPIMI